MIATARSRPGMPPAGRPDSQGHEWADPPAAEIEAITVETLSEPWAQVLNRRKEWPLFVRRMKDLGVGNWQLLFEIERRRALDVGSGFGSLVLGLSRSFRFAVGVEYLPQRTRYAMLRANQDEAGAAFTRASGFALPFADGSFDLVSFNGVVEWAGLYRAGAPRGVQLEMLEEAARVLRPSGVLAVAIENRYALESVLGQKDTHTGLTGITLLPRQLASIMSRLSNRGEYRTYLYSLRGYKRLLRDAGLRTVRVFDLIGSYNNYKYVVGTHDSASYAFLYQRRLPQHSYGPAQAARTFLGRAWPAVLPRLAYSYLIVAGNEFTTTLDSESRLWTMAGVSPGKARFGCRGRLAGELAVVAHDGLQVRSVIEFVPEVQDSGDDLCALPDGLREEVLSSLRVRDRVMLSDGAFMRSWSRP